jgi:hypothetical protein
MAEDIVVKVRITLSAGTPDHPVAGPDLETTPGALMPDNP